MMSIPWESIERKPLGQHRVDGQALLDLRAAKADLELQVAGLIKEQKVAKDALTEAQNRIAALEATNGEFKKRANDLEKSTSELSSAKSLQEGTIIASKAEIHQLESKLATASRNSSELSDKLAKMKEVAEKVPNLEREIATITKALADKQASLEEKEGALAAANLKISDLEGAREASEEKIQKIQSEIAQKTSSRDAQLVEAKGKAAEVELLRSKVKELETKIGDLTEELERVKPGSKTVEVEGPSGVAAARAAALARSAALAAKRAGEDKKEPEEANKD